jgi:hypothetical protein
VITYRLTRRHLFDSASTVAFGIFDPADDHEAWLRLDLSRAAWEAQGSPHELALTLTAPQEPT